jgi:WhiB family redox-sensing transcriptional regulator
MVAVLRVPFPPDWMGEAACANVDPEIFMPNPGGSPRAALEICNGHGKDMPVCPVREECLMYALMRHEPLGIWGGKTARQRGRMDHPARASRYE